MRRSKQRGQGGLLGALKSRATLLCSANSSTTSPLSPHAAVLRATAHEPSTISPQPHHLAALLSFGRGPRSSAAALVSALSSRLRSARSAPVALKSLLAIHHLLASSSPFIIRDQLLHLLLPPVLGGGPPSPLLLSSFSDPSDPLLSSLVRHLARHLELLLLLPPNPPDLDDWLSALLTGHLIAELEHLVAIAEEIGRFPFPAFSGEHDEDEDLSSSPPIVHETVRLVHQDRVAAEHGIHARIREFRDRIREFRDRIGSISLAESLELLCLLKRLEDIDRGDQRPYDRRWKVGVDRVFWEDVRELRARVGELVVKREAEERERRRAMSEARRLRVSESARISYRDSMGSADFDPVRFGSSRWR